MPERPTFQRRLLTRLGAALAVALAVIGTAVWGGAAVWSATEARRVLRLEVQAVQNDVVLRDGQIDADRYYWDEPHHRFDAERIDPFFLQVFDAEGRLLRASENVALFAPGAFPARPRARTDEDGLLAPLATFRVGTHTLYYVTEPLRGPDGRPVGMVQVARFVPAVQAHLGRLALGLAVGLGLALLALLALLRIVGGRVVQPLRAITAHAASLSPATLGERVPVPLNADRETAMLAMTLNGALDRLDAAFDEMKRFTANAAHELQTPLTVLRGHVEVALRRDREPDAYRQTLRVLDGEVDSMTRTVRGLLALARLDAAPLTMEPVDLAQIARSEAETLRPMAEAKGLALGVHAPETAMARGHADLLREAIRTVLDNAIKYTEAGHVALAVGTRKEEAWVAVEDSGPGMSSEHRAHATDRFWRAPDVQHLPGSGLGLALADRVARTHGGRLVLSDADPKGLRVVLTVPGVPREPGPGRV